MFDYKNTINQYTNQSKPPLLTIFVHLTDFIITLTIYISFTIYDTIKTDQVPLRQPTQSRHLQLS